MKYIYIIYINILLVGLLSSCEKFLDEKSDVALAIPSTLEELDDLMNFYRDFVDDPNAGEIATDDFYLLDDDFNSLNSPDAKYIYILGDEVFLEDNQNDWKTVYNGIYYCNLVLEKLEAIEKNGEIEDRARFNKVKGEALFLRARRYLHAAWVWCLAYDSKSASVDLGLPLRLKSNFNENVGRSSVQETYDRIIADLKLSSLLLPERAIHKVKASKPAALAVLARTYLSMRDYRNALIYADSTLMYNSCLLNFNDLDQSKTQPIYEFNDEVIMSSALRNQTILSRTRLKVSNDLYGLFTENDLRKFTFFFENPNQTIGFRAHFGNVSGTSMFNGPAVNEMYLIRAEGYCRSGETTLAVLDMNRLLSHRYDADNFVPIDENINAEELLEIILDERRKELLFRGIRWMDIKRLNKEGHQINIKKTVNGEEYILPANDKRAAMMLPRTVVELGNYKQNPR